MRKNSIVPLVLVLAASFAIASCQKIQEPTPVKATLKVTASPFADAIPLAYGQLVAVTGSADPYVGVLWFKRPDESIVVVRLNYGKGELGQRITEIPRK